MKDLGDKVDSETKNKVQVEIDSLKKLMESDDVEAIKKGLESLTQASHKLAEMMYAQATKDKAAEGAETAGQASGTKKDDDDVVDADFEEVK
jgi:molecular chaperone DnaK